MNFWIYSVPIVILQNFQKQFLRIVHTLYGSLFHAFTHQPMKFLKKFPNYKWTKN
jgi:hypothetical protein